MSKIWSKSGHISFAIFVICLIAAIVAERVFGAINFARIVGAFAFIQIIVVFLLNLCYICLKR